MALFRLLSSQHIGPDYSQEPEIFKVTDSRGKVREDKRYPSKLYKQGDLVEDPADLVARFPNKFVFVSGTARPVQGAAQAAFPGGQVVSGLQVTIQTEDGRSFAGPADALLTPEVRRQLGMKVEGVEYAEDDVS